MTQVERFGKFLLLEKLASGGMAEIYLAKAPGASGINKFVAIKRILPQYSDNPEFIEMFKYEAKIAINLGHSNIVSIYEFGIEQAQFFLVMDFVEGKNLRQILNRMKQTKQTFSIEQILYIVREAAAGLDSAHRCLDGSTGRPLNITHRDMSPQNIMISYEGEIRIIDFGIAKAESQLESTKAGTLKGKFGYMSPEQAEGVGVDLRTDIFSLGIVLWELLANERLFIANNEMNTLRKIRECQVPSLRKLNPKISEELEKIVNKSLTRDRGVRYQTAAAFHRDVSTFLNKNYPAFSPHDFSNTIKTLFSDEIVTTRRKLMEYAKLDVDSVAVSSPPQEELTSTQTATSPSSTSNEQEILESTRKKMNFKDLVDASGKGRKRLVTRTVNDEARAAATAITKTPSSVSNGLPLNRVKGKAKAVRRPKLQMPPTPLAIIAFVALFLLIVEPAKIKTLFSRNTVQVAANDVANEGQATSTSKQERYILSIYSKPPQADIHMKLKRSEKDDSSAADGNDISCLTPCEVHLEPHKTYDLTLKLPGHLGVETVYTADKPVDRFEALLLKAPQAYLNIAVFPKSKVFVFINEQRIPQNPPIRKFAIPANKEIVVKALDPLTNAKAVKSVIVEENKVEDVKLFLNKPEKKP